LGPFAAFRTGFDAFRTGFDAFRDGFDAFREGLDRLREPFGRGFEAVARVRLADLREVFRRSGRRLAMVGALFEAQKP